MNHFIWIVVEISFGYNRYNGYMYLGRYLFKIESLLMTVDFLVRSHSNYFIEVTTTF